MQPAKNGECSEKPVSVLCGELSFPWGWGSLIPVGMGLGYSHGDGARPDHGTQTTRFRCCPPGLGREIPPFQCWLGQDESAAPALCTCWGGRSPLVSAVQVGRGRMNRRRWGHAGQWGGTKGSGTRGHVAGDTGTGAMGPPRHCLAKISLGFLPPNTLEVGTWPEIAAGHQPGGKARSTTKAQLWGRRDPALPKLTKKT